MTDACTYYFFWTTEAGGSLVFELEIILSFFWFPLYIYIYRYIYIYIHIYIYIYGDIYISTYIYIYISTVMAVSLCFGFRCMWFLGGCDVQKNQKDIHNVFVSQCVSFWGHYTMWFFHYDFTFTILIKRNPPPNACFLFTMFPDQKPGGRGHPWKHLVKKSMGVLFLRVLDQGT